MDAPVRVVVDVPGLRIESPLNVRESHWFKRKRRGNEHYLAVKVALSSVPDLLKRALRNADRVELKLVRIGGRKLDRDNVAAGFKHVLDAVCMWLLVDDGDEERLGVAWSQEPGGPYSVRIEMEGVR